MFPRRFRFVALSPAAVLIRLRNCLRLAAGEGAS
jgi:hypothetical protein